MGVYGRKKNSPKQIDRCTIIIYKLDGVCKSKTADKATQNNKTNR